MTIDDIIRAIRHCLERGGNKDCRIGCPYVDQSCGACAPEQMLYDAANALEAAYKRIAVLEDELRFQLDTRRKETAEIERLKAENLKLQKQNRDCGWNCKQCEYMDKDLQAEEAEQRLMELDRRLYELRSFNAKMKGE